MPRVYTFICLMSCSGIDSAAAGGAGTGAGVDAVVADAVICW